VKQRVAVVYGGRSGEHEVSVRSAESIMKSLDRERFEVLPYFISKTGKWSPRAIQPEPGGNPEIDVVFPIVHGTFGEDGTLQGLLEMAGLPYVGGGVFASSAAMDKEQFKHVCEVRGLPVVEYLVQRHDALDAGAVLRRFELPVFVKPANLGSSVGVAKAKTKGDLETALRDAALYDSKVLIERAIVGQELECAVLGNEDARAATPCEILPSREFYDYEDKYLLDKAQIVLPARITPEQMAEVKRQAVECFLAVECSGLARVDFLLESATGNIYINEINTLPGFTSISMYPKMWAHDGIEFPKLVERLIELALERHARRQALRYER
jgi:D-alanine-D-alanine ligase